GVPRPNATPAPKIPSIFRREIISAAVFLLMFNLPCCANTSRSIGWGEAVPKEGDAVPKDSAVSLRIILPRPCSSIFVGLGDHHGAGRRCNPKTRKFWPG